jgi:hypothetical protein
MGRFTGGVFGQCRTAAKDHEKGAGNEGTRSPRRSYCRGYHAIQLSYRILFSRTGNRPIRKVFPRSNQYPINIVK